jgi:hypothetical protein
MDFLGRDVRLEGRHHHLLVETTKRQRAIGKMKITPRGLLTPANAAH